MSSKARKISFLLILTIVISSCPVFGLPAITIVYYVAINGNDSNDGSLDNPFRTLEAAKNAVRLDVGWY